MLSPITDNEELNAFLFQLVSDLTGSDIVTTPSSPSTGAPVTYPNQWLYVKYAVDNVGTGFANAPFAGAYYWGLLNSATASPESSNSADYTWYYYSAGFGGTKFLFYLVVGARQVKFVIDTVAPNYKWLVDPGTAINLDTLVPGATITSTEIADGSITPPKTNLAAINNSTGYLTGTAGIGNALNGTAPLFTAGSCTTIPNLTGMVTSVGNATTVVTNANLTGGVTSVGNAATVVTNANLTGGVTSVGNAATVVTNANLTGPITSSGNATSVASQTGTGSKFVMDTSPTLVTPDLGTPSACVGTNITGTASGLTAGNVTTNANLTGGVTSVGNAATVVTNANLTGGVTSVGNAATVVTNANLTGPITSVGNATSIASQTGTGTKFVVDTSPTLITPVLGVATGTSLRATGVLGTGGYTVAGLPAGTIGDRAYVTNALAPAFGATVVGGGAVTIPVFYDGTNWIVG